MQVRDRVRELRRVRAAELVPHPRNWRTHPAAQVDALRGVLAEVGYADALIGRELPDGRVQLLDGHARAEVTPDQTVPVLIVDVDDAEAEKVLATLDPLAAMAGRDEEKLAALLAEIDTESEALRVMLDGLGATSPSPPVSAPVADEPPPPEEELPPPVTRPGDLWRLGSHRLLCGDSTGPATVAACLDGTEPYLQVVDPPFDLDYDPWPPLPCAKVLYVWARGDKALIWMTFLGLGEHWGLHTLCFTGAARGWARPEQPCLVHEVVYVLRRKGTPAVLDRPTAAALGLRLTEDGRHFSFYEGLLFRDNEMSWAKPVKCMEIGLAYTPPGSSVYDPCAGAGSMLLACERHGRTFLGIEKQPRWCDYAVGRWEKQTGRKAERNVLTDNDLNRYNGTGRGGGAAGPVDTPR